MEEKRQIPIPAGAASLTSSGRPAAAAFRDRTVASGAFASRVRKAKRLLISLVAAGIAISLMLVAASPRLYQVRASIEIQDPPAKYQLNDDGTGRLAPATESYIESQIRVLESRSLLERALSKLPESEQERLLRSSSFTWSGHSNERDLETLRRHLSAHASQNSRVIDISLICVEAAAGVRLINLLTQEMMNTNIDRAWHAAKQNRQWTEFQLQNLQQRWEESEQALAEYVRNSGMEIESVQRVADHSRQRSNAARLQQLKAQLADFQNQTDQWEKLYGASSPEVLKLQANAKEAETAIRQLGAAARAASANPANDPEPDRIKMRAHLNALKEDAAANRLIYENAATRLRVAEIIDASHIGEISVIDAPTASAGSDAPNIFARAGLGALAGLTLGVFVVGLRGLISRTFDEPAILEAYLGLNVLGSIPVRSANMRSQPDPVSTKGSVQIHFDRDPGIAEAYRSIRSSIILSNGQNPAPGRILFISPGDYDGKACVVGNLGATLASARRRVLLIDGDLRKPALHEFFGASNHQGLADLLSKQITADPIAMRELIQDTQIPDLYLLAAGNAGVRGPEILSSPGLPPLMREFAKAFDVVLIDSPPLIPFADARSLARAADAVVLVIKAGVTDRKLAMLARDTMLHDGTHIMGTILADYNGAAASAVA